MKKKRKKQNNFTKHLHWIIPSILMLALLITIILFATGVWKLPISQQTIITNTTIIDRLNNPQNLPGVTCSLALIPTTITLGDSVSGTIKDGKNTQCSVYFKYVPGLGDIYASQDWTLDSVIQIGPTGTYTNSRTPDKTGTFTFAVICGDCVTDQVQLEINKPIAETLNCNTFCMGKGYESGRNVDDCSYCNLITEVCEVSLDEPTGTCCCKLSEPILGCNDNDFTQTDFDNSIMFSGHCIDDLGQHNDECSPDGLLKEWSCPIGGDTCSHTFINCKSYLGADAVCSNGQCLSQPECNINIECSYIYGDGYVCRNNVCVEVTGVNCNQIVQDEGYSMGIWDPMGSYSQSCYEFCTYNCANGCDRSSTAGTWGLCCGYDCI